MKIHSLLFATIGVGILSCGSNETHEQAMLASRSTDSVKAEWLKPHETIIRLHIESEDPTTLLTEASITYNDGESGATVTMVADQLMTHPFQRDYSVDPCSSQTEVEIKVRAGDTVLVCRTLLPHLELDTRTQFNLSISPMHLRMISSWIESQTEGLQYQVSSLDSVFVGYYLDNSGAITPDYKSTSVAMVIETDGRHGKAVALSDKEGEWIFSTLGSSSGQVFGTLDGKACEGFLPQKGVRGDSLHCLIYNPTLHIAEGALSEKDGYALCRKLNVSSRKETIRRNDMRNAYDLRIGAYVPSASEMARLFYYQNGYFKTGITGQGFKPLKGAYLTSSESGADTYYSFDFDQGALSGHNSKRYTPLKIRLYYIF